jgi:hypothetical protein
MNGAPLNVIPQSEKKHGGPMYLRRASDTCDICFQVLKWCMTKDLEKKNATLVEEMYTAK